MKFTYRIKKNRVFKKILKIGRYANSKNITVHVLKNKQNKSFFGVCVSKKNGISVHRNKLKRWAREVYKIEEEKLKKGYFIVIIYRKNTTINDVNFEIVKTEICKCFKDLDLYEK